jgi:hypothetical protein
MNGETTDAEIRHIFAALWPRGSGARLVKTTAKRITTVDNAVTQA